MTYYERNIKRDIERRVKEPGKIIVLYGPRQTGKTTLVKKILDENQSMNGYFNCEERSVTDVLLSHDPSLMAAFFGGNEIVVLDEAQTIMNIGRALKILIDAYPKINIIATGSSSFDLANKINEPLTGRHYEFFLYPLSFDEIAEQKGNRVLLEQVERRLVYGCYPEIVLSDTLDDARERLKMLASSYLYRDVFKFKSIKSPEVLMSILRALAYQVGNEVSLTEIASLVGVDKNTVSTYINLLEQSFIIFRLSSYRRNLRNEIKKGKKFYFFDNGIISALTENFVSPKFGRDVGGLWENLMISERLKYNQNRHLYKNLYFWRLRSGGEIDLIEESDGKLTPFEFKWRKNKLNLAAKRFESTYATDAVRIINNENFINFVR
jgi:predicted AAA+ superfamily ATPase